MTKPATVENGTCTYCGRGVDVQQRDNFPPSKFCVRFRHANAPEPEE